MPPLSLTRRARGEESVTYVTLRENSLTLHIVLTN